MILAKVVAISLGLKNFGFLMGAAGMLGCVIGAAPDVLWYAMNKLQSWTWYELFHFDDRILRVMWWTIAWPEHIWIDQFFHPPGLLRDGRYADVVLQFSVHEVCLGGVTVRRWHLIWALREACVWPFIAVELFLALW
jgi:hypothetical protein